MHRLEYFVSRWLLPALNGGSPLGREAAALLRPRRVMEAVQWMDLAVDAGLFSAQAASLAIQSYAVPFFDALVSNSPSSRWAMRTGQIDVVHSSLSLELMTELPPRGRWLLKRGMRREPLFSGTGRRVSLLCARGVVESLLPLYGTLATSTSFQWLTHLIRFAPDRQWNAIWREGCTTGEVARYQLDPASPAGPCALAYAGFLDYSGFAAQCRQRLESADGASDAAKQDSGSVDSSDAPMPAVLHLRDRLRGLLAWRLHLRRPAAQQRLAQLCQKVAADIHEEWTRVSADGAHAEQILRTMAESFDVLGIVLPSEATAVVPKTSRPASLIELPRPSAALVHLGRRYGARPRASDRDRSSACLVSL